MEIPQRLASLIGFITIDRVCGELSLTRAIGDREYKGNFKNIYWKHHFNEDLVLSIPEIVNIQINPKNESFDDNLNISMDTSSCNEQLSENCNINEKDEFLILACDGLWDVFTNQEAVDFVKISIDSFGDPKKTVIDLVNEAIKLGSMDNITVLVCFFKQLTI
jgi:serine/threonine protein phosphatase PrpC